LQGLEINNRAELAICPDAFNAFKKLDDSGLVLPEFENASRRSFCFLLRLVGVST
jgi:hypothetical protein